MKDLFSEHYVDVPEERFDLLGDAQEKVEELEKKLNEQLEANVELNKSVKDMKEVKFFLRHPMEWLKLIKKNLLD